LPIITLFLPKHRKQVKIVNDLLFLCPSSYMLHEKERYKKGRGDITIFLRGGL
jgi:hypothetical protein